MVAPIIVSYSELDTYRQCPLKHHITYGQRWTKPPTSDGALAKGSLYHLVMEEHMRVIWAYQQTHGGRNPKIGSAEESELLDLCRVAVRRHLVDSNGYQTPVQELIQWMHEGWISNYGTNPDWKILGVEHQIITPLRNERGQRTRYHLKAKIDLLVALRSSGGRFVVDHKSGANLPTDMDLEIDDQFGLYCWAMNEVGQPVVGAIHASNRTQRNKGPMSLDTRMRLTYLSRSKQELKNIALDAYKVAWNAHPPKNGGPKGYSSPDPRSCGWKCDIKEPHLLARKGRNIQEVLIEYGFKIDRTRH